jgi:uncharacterized SAM-binding protein YcdF (DUF218 family)
VIRRVLFTIVVFVGSVVVVTNAGLFLFPRTHTPAKADAVVVFRGGRGERLNTALRLMEAKVAAHLIIPNGTVASWPQANRLCRGRHSFTVSCPDPEVENTRGEARAIAGVARDKGWRSLVLVTSTYHVTRARLLLGRCFDGRLDAVKAGPGLTPGRYLARVSHEWAGLAEAELVNRGC